MEELKKKKEKFDDEYELEYKKLARASINKHIAERDERRRKKQWLEDQGWKMDYSLLPKPEPIIEEPKIIEKIKEKIIPKKPLPIIEIPKPAKEVIEIIEAKVEHAKFAAEHAANKIEAAIMAVEDIPSEWINKYEFNTGKKAIWRGQITNGFKEFIKTNGLNG